MDNKHRGSLKDLDKKYVSGFDETKFMLVACSAFVKFNMFIIWYL